MNNELRIMYDGCNRENLEVIMPKKKIAKISKKNSIPRRGVMRNQFFGMILIALGLGALIVVVRYFVISLQVPTSVYEIQTSELIPGAK